MNPMESRFETRIFGEPDFRTLITIANFQAVLLNSGAIRLPVPGNEGCPARAKTFPLNFRLGPTSRQWLQQPEAPATVPVQRGGRQISGARSCTRPFPPECI